ncbi:Antiviral helicase SKI2, partial [Schistosoma japonicum]
MPARCVVFTSIDKYDGHMIRPLTSSEYTQMAGRAGRRGLDAKGYVIILVSSIGKSHKSRVTGLPTESVLRSVILGTQTRLVTQFKVTYSMILNLHRSSSLTLRQLQYYNFPCSFSVFNFLDHFAHLVMEIGFGIYCLCLSQTGIGDVLDVRLFEEYSTINDQLNYPLSISDTTTLNSNLFNSSTFSSMYSKEILNCAYE